MLIENPPARHARRKKNAAPNLTLVSATTSQVGPLVFLNLTFDRNVDVTAIDVTQFTLNYPPLSLIYRGSSVVSASGKTMQLGFTSIGMSTGPTAQFTATANTRITAGDGGMWPGLTNMTLPLV